MHFLVFQHVDVEHPGIFLDFWRAAGITWTTIELDEGEPIPVDLARYDALVVMGGPMDVWQTDKHSWLAPEIEAIRVFACDLGKPFLGVCLGHQLLAEALGGKCGVAAAPEIGPCPVTIKAEGRTDRLLAGLPSPLTTFQWHGAEVKALPRDATVLAETDLCRIQAFRWRKHAWGLQFHAEITSKTVDEWGRIPEYARSLEVALGPASGERLAQETLRLLPAFESAAARLNDNFLAAIKEHARGLVLGS